MTTYPESTARLLARIDHYSARFTRMTLEADEASYAQVDSAFAELCGDQQALLPAAAPQILALGLASCDAIEALYAGASGTTAVRGGRIRPLGGAPLARLLLVHDQALDELQRQLRGKPSLDADSALGGLESALPLPPQNQASPAFHGA